LARHTTARRRRPTPAQVRRPGEGEDEPPSKAVGQPGSPPGPSLFALLLEDVRLFEEQTTDAKGNHASVYLDLDRYRIVNL